MERKIQIGYLVLADSALSFLLETIVEKMSDQPTM
jgi:hypothetical protein